MQAWELDRELGKIQDKLEAIETHVNDFLYCWIINEDIANWYSHLQKIIQGCSESAKEEEK